MIYKNYQVIGLQRTGTNWLNDLVKHNFEVEPVSKGFWKHLTPLGGRPRTKRYLHWKHKAEDLILEDNVFYVATSKDWDTWLDSLNRNAQDFSITHAGVFRNNIPSTKKVYEAWHDWRIQNQDMPNFFYRDYLDWLNNWKEYFDKIHVITKWKKKHKTFEDITWKVENSRNYDPERYVRSKQ